MHEQKQNHYKLYVQVSQTKISGYTKMHEIMYGII